MAKGNDRKPFNSANSYLNSHLGNNNDSPKQDFSLHEPVRGTIFINDPSAGLKTKHSERYSWNLNLEDQFSHQESPKVPKSIVYATPFWEMDYSVETESVLKSPEMSEETNKIWVFDEPTFACEDSKQSLNFKKKESITKERNIETVDIGKIYSTNLCRRL